MEAIYVLELHTGAIKIGRTEQLFTRLKQHAGAAASCNLGLGQVWSCPVRDSKIAEQRLLTATRAIPGARATETNSVFQHVSFFEAVSLARCICLEFKPLSVGPAVANLEDAIIPDDLELIRSAFEAHGNPANLSSAEICEYLGSVEPRELARRMHVFGIFATSIRAGTRILRGYRLKDVIHAVTAARHRASWGVIAGDGDAP